MTAGALLAGVAAIVSLTTASTGASGEVIPVPASGQLTVTGHGNGHGHGLSAYGARGAALAGQSPAQILAFYYPGTTLTTIGAKTVRVVLSNDGGTTTVGAKAGLSVTGVAGTLPTTPYTKWRLAVSGSGLALQAYGAAGWLSYKLGLPAQADFKASNGIIREYKNDGTSTDYYGTVGAVRHGAGLLSINRVAMDQYVQGVAPREIPPSWPAAAVQAHAIAARSFAYYEMSTHTSALYDVCDNTNCQVYGGKAHYSSAGSLLTTDSPPALTGNNNKVLLYQGAPVLAQYAASDGGASISGGLPYLVTKLDPYDNAASGDPYLKWTRTVPSSAVASDYGLATVTKIEITGRSGAGAFGGWVTAGFVNGVDHNGHTQRVAATGNGLASAMNLPTAFFDIAGAAPPPLGHLDATTLVGADSVQFQGWAFDPSSPTVSTRVDVRVGSSLTSTTANGARADVQAHYHLSTATHGFTITVAIPATQVSVCVYAQDAKNATPLALGCRTLGQSPRGHLDQSTLVDPSHLVLDGWTYDPDTGGGPGAIVVSVGDQSYPFSADGARHDVQLYYHLATPNEGFVVTVPLLAGTQRVCVWSKNLGGGGADLLLSCRNYTAVTQ